MLHHFLNGNHGKQNWNFYVCGLCALCVSTLYVKLHALHITTSNKKLSSVEIAIRDNEFFYCLYKKVIVPNSCHMKRQSKAMQPESVEKVCQLIIHNIIFLDLMIGLLKINNLISLLILSIFMFLISLHC